MSDYDKGINQYSTFYVLNDFNDLFQVYATIEMI